MVIGDNVQRVYDNAFRGCKSLTSVTIGNSVTSIGEDAFYGCTSIKDVYYTGDLEGWLGISFNNFYSTPMYYATNLYFDGELVTSVTIPDSVTSIGDGVFHNCPLLQYNEYDNGYYLANESNPYFILIKVKNKNINTFKIHNSTKIIDYRVFFECASLSYIDIPNGVIRIGSAAFGGCISLTSITIPNTVISIGDSAFAGCKSLTRITIPSSVSSIGAYAFNVCISLTYVTFENVEGWWYSSFSNATKGWNISSADIADNKGVAYLLKELYCGYYWKRTE